MNSRRDLYTGLFLLAFVTFLAWSIYFFPPEASLFPLGVLFVMGFLAVILIIRAYLRRDQPKERPFMEKRRNFFLTVALFFLYATGVSLLGYFTASAIFLCGFPVVLGYQRYRELLLFSSVYLVGVYIFFVLLFERILPPELFLALS